jgi:hypothetical protein
VARAPCGYDRLFSSLNTSTFCPLPNTVSCIWLMFSSARSALAPRRASHAQPDDRVWPKSERSSIVHRLAMMKKPFEQPNAVHFRLRSWMFNSSFMTDPTPPYALYALVSLTLSCDACIANTAMRVLLLDVCPVGSSA